MIYQVHKSLFFSLFLITFCQIVNAQNYSEDITDSSTGIIEAGSEHGGNVPNLAEYAFDNNIITQGWASEDPSNFPAWLSYEFPQTVGPKIVVAYSIYCSNQQSNSWPALFIPVRWTLEGENSEGIFLLDSVVMAEINVNEWKLFEFENTQHFDKYIFTFYETAGNQPYTFITEMELHEPAKPLSVTPLNSEMLINVFPNPANNVVTISVKDRNVFNISVFNNLGQKVDFLNDIYISNNLQLDCSRYGKGIYFLHFESNNGSSTKQIIIE